MSRRLLEAGHDVIVWNRSSGATDELVALGARRAANSTEALSADLSFSMLANDAALLEVLTDDAIMALAGRTHVVMATISPSLADQMAEKFAAAGATYIAAPVLGRPAVAAEGNLNLMVAGASQAVDAVQPFFDILGKRTWRFGEKPSVAYAVKAAVNYNLIHVIEALGESVAMTERQGVAPELFVELLTSTLFGGVAYTGYGDIIAKKAYMPAGFHIALGRKDLGLAEEVALAGGITLPTLPALKAVFDRALADPELQNADWSALAEVTRRDLL